MTIIRTYDQGDGTTSIADATLQRIRVVEGGTGPTGPQGPAGADGAAGTAGSPGDPGPGVAVGGTAGQILAKIDSADYNTEWVDAASGGGAVDSVNGQTGLVVLAATDVGADASGAAATALSTAEGYTDTAITAEVSRANAAYDATGAAAAAQAAAIAASQPLDTDLTAIAALATTSFGRALLTQADAAALRTTAGLGTAATSNTGDFDAAGAAAAAQAASQPLDSDLTAIAALATTSFGRSFLALADAAAGRTLLGLGTAATQASTAFDAAGAAAAAQAASQPLDTDLTALAGLTSAADKLPYFTGAGTAAVTAFTAAGRALVDDADAAAQRTTLGLGTAATISATAGGDLSGTLPSPTVAKINGVAVTGTPSVGYVPTATSSSAATWQAAAGGSTTRAANALAPTGALYDTMPREYSDGSAYTLTSGTLLLVGIDLPSGLTIGHIAFMNSRTIVSATHWWFGLWNSSLAQLAVTADQTNAAWSSADSIKSLAIATVATGAASTFTTTYAGRHYLGVAMTAGTTAQIIGRSVSASLSAETPRQVGNSTTGLTTPPSFPSTASAVGGGGTFVYGHVAA